MTSKKQKQLEEKAKQSMIDREFLRESNYIEREYRGFALEDAVEAWNYLKTRKALYIEEILEMHRILMRNTYPQIAGHFRDCDVFIGGERKVFLSQIALRKEVQGVVGQMFSTLPLGTTQDKEALAKKVHVAFEEVHPFQDGNGRIGRMLYNYHRLKLGLPVHVIHEGLEQMEYYKWFAKENI